MSVEGRETGSHPLIGEGVARVVAVAGVALFAYEWTKSLLFPNLTIWESHAMTIVVGSVVAGVAAAMVLRRQVQLHGRLVAHEVAAAEARGSEARYRRLVEASPEAMVVHRGHHVVYANPACALMLGSEGETFVGADLREAIDAADLPLLDRRLAALADGEPADPSAVVEYRVRTRAGTTLTVEALTVRVTHDGEPAFLTMLRDVTPRKALEARLVHQAMHDPLTGLPNRPSLMSRIAQALSRVTRGETVALLVLDLDHFKRINDSWGHAAGDEVLRVVARRLLAAVRGHDTVARLGGDEFVVLLERLATVDEATLVVERIRAALRRPIALEGRPVSTSATVGLAFAHEIVDGGGEEALLRHADLALYVAKGEGRDRVATFTRAMHAETLERLSIERALHRAVAAIETGVPPFTLRYQPIVDLASGEAIGVEALLRWRDAERGWIAPASFIPIAETSGLMPALGRWVLDRACADLAGWDAAGMPPLTLNVNLSPRQLQDAGLVDVVAQTLARHGLAAGRLVLEITEGTMLEDAEATRSTLRALKALGIRLAVDDFGTGYSSLAYLRRFPVDVVKIDRTFVASLDGEGRDATLVQAIVDMARALSLVTVAEGIETGEALEVLRAIGCARGQGYLFARPCTAPELVEWWQARATGTPKRAGVAPALAGHAPRAARALPPMGLPVAR